MLEKLGVFGEDHGALSWVYVGGSKVVSGGVDHEWLLYNEKNSFVASL